MKKFTFPEGFKWGSATAAIEIEGNGNKIAEESHSVWSWQYQESPEDFFEQRFTSNNFNERYDEDLKIAQDLNFDSLRTSITWQRVMPDGVNISQEGIDYYDKVFKSFEDHGLELFLTLNHIDMPKWAADLGGWGSREVIDKFVDFAKVVFEHWGDKIAYLETFNEPNVLANRQWILGETYPKHKHDWLGFIKTLYGQNLAHHKVQELYESLGFKGKFGIVLNMSPVLPETQDEDDLKAAETVFMLLEDSYLSTMVHGKFPEKLIEWAKERNAWDESFVEPEDAELFAKYNIDHLGINNYGPTRIKAPTPIDPNAEVKAQSNMATDFYQQYSKEGVRMNVSRGWEIRPKSIYELMMLIKNKYNNIPVFVSENGMGIENEERYRKNGMIQDYYRIQYINEHLYWLHKAIEDGSKLFGYHQWTYIDNWSWRNAYKNRYGYIELDLETGERKEKLSAAWIREVIKNNGSEISEEDVPKNE